MADDEMNTDGGGGMTAVDGGSGTTMGSDSGFDFASVMDGSNAQSDSVKADDQQTPAQQPAPTSGPILYGKTPEGHWIMQDTDGSRYHVFNEQGYLHGVAYEGDMPSGASEAEPPELYPEPAPQAPLRDMAAEALDYYRAKLTDQVSREMIEEGADHPDDPFIIAYKKKYMPEQENQDGTGVQAPVIPAVTTSPGLARAVTSAQTPATTEGGEPSPVTPVVQAKAAEQPQPVPSEEPSAVGINPDLVGPNAVQAAPMSTPQDPAKIMKLSAQASSSTTDTNPDANQGSGASGLMESLDKGWNATKDFAGKIGHAVWNAGNPFEPDAEAAELKVPQVPSIPPSLVGSIQRESDKLLRTLEYTKDPLYSSDVKDRYDVKDISDCSSFVATVFKRCGIDLPSNSRAQYTSDKLQNVGKEPGDWQAGDLVFWGTNNSPSHVAIYAGDGIVYNMGEKGGCQKIPLESVKKEIIGAKRLLPENVPQQYK